MLKWPVMVRWACVFLGIPRGMIFANTIWLSQMWAKDFGYSNTIVGLLGSLGLVALLKVPVLGYVDSLNLRGFLATRHRLSGLLLFLVLMYCLGLGVAALATPGRIFVFVFGMVLAHIMGTFMELVLEMLRIEVGRSPAGLRKDRIAGDFGVGDRVGSIISKPLLLLCVVWVSWPFGVVTMVVVVLLCALAVFALDDRLLVDDASALKPRSLNYKHVVRAVRNMLGTYGWWSGLLFPIAIILNDAFVRPMIGVMLLDVSIPFESISMGYLILYVGGAVGSILLTRFMPHHCVFQRLHISVLINTLVNAMFGICAWKPVPWVVWCMMLLSGVSQGVLLQLFRVALEDLCSPRYAFIQMGVLLTIWSMGAPLSALAGYLVDLLHSWSLYFVVVSVLSLPAGLAIRRVMAVKRLSSCR